MWREVLLSILFAIRWRTESVERALEPEEGLDRASVRRMVEVRSALAAGSYWKRRGLLDKVATYAKQQDEVGIQRKIAAQLLSLYIRTSVEDVMWATRNSINLFTAMLIALVVPAVGLSAVMYVLAPESVYLLYFSALASLALLPFLDRMVPELGPYEMRLFPLFIVGGAVGYLVGGTAGLALGVAIGAAPHVALWARRWWAYENELRKFAFVVETARQGGLSGRTELGRFASRVYDYVRAAGSFDLEVFARDLLLIASNFFYWVRNFARGRGIALLVMAAVAAALGPYIYKFLAPLASGSQQLGLPPVPPFDPLPYVFAAAVWGAVAGRMLDSRATMPLGSAIAALASWAVVSLV